MVDAFLILKQNKQTKLYEILRDDNNFSEVTVLINVV